MDKIKIIAREKLQNSKLREKVEQLEQDKAELGESIGMARYELAVGNVETAKTYLTKALSKAGEGS